jgi:hypothetical protein
MPLALLNCSTFTCCTLCTHTCSLQGDATVWTYLYGNCSLDGETPPTAGLEVNLMLTKDGKPFGGVALDGVAMTGMVRCYSCVKYTLHIDMPLRVRCAGSAQYRRHFSVAGTCLNRYCKVALRDMHLTQHSSLDTI